MWLYWGRSSKYRFGGIYVVPVKVKAKGIEAVVETYAFFDPGSNASFCTDQLIE